MKLAILQMSDTPQVESSALMLRHAGYEVMTCGHDLCGELRRIGGDCVVHVDSARAGGCDPLDPTIRQASLADMDRCDLFADVKVNNVARVKERWPRLRDRVCFWRLNGGRPEHVVRKDGTDCGDEWNPGAPAITANLWYGRTTDPRGNHGWDGDDVGGTGQPSKNYTFWPPYPRAAMFAQPRSGRGSPPFCLCHGVQGWGYNVTMPDMLRMGVRVYGIGAPHGTVPHTNVPDLVRDSVCMVHLKTTDCPGWALYEAILGGCPVVVSRMLVARCRMEPLFEDGQTCLAFGPPGDPAGHGDMGYAKCVEDVRAAVASLKTNQRLGDWMAQEARRRLLELMWTPERDGAAFKSYLERTFP